MAAALGSGEVVKIAGSMPTLPAHRWPPLPLGVRFSSLLAVPPGPCCSEWVWGRAAPALAGHLRGTNAHAPQTFRVAVYRAARQQGPPHLCPPQCQCMTSLGHPRVPVLRTEPRGLSLAVLCLYHHPSLRSFQLYLPHSPVPCCISPPVPTPTPLSLALHTPTSTCHAYPAFSLWGITGILELTAPETSPP